MPRTATVVATEPTECLVLVRWEFIAKLRSDPEVVIVLLRQVARSFQKALKVI